MRIQQYDITVIENDVTIHCKGQLEFATLWGLCGVQHNFEKDSEEDKALNRRLKIVSQEMLEIDKIIQKGENNE